MLSDVMATMPQYWPVWLLVAYLMGAIPTGYLLVKARTGQDIRTIGSGSTGTTNVKRALGGKAALVVLAADILKAFIPVFAARALAPQATWLHVGMALMAIIGHSKPVFLGFKGGKSAASGLGTLFALWPAGALLLAVVVILVFRWFKTVSVASLTACLLSPPLFYLSGQPVPYCVYVLLAALYVIVLHRDNILRLMQGQDNPLT